MFYPLEKTARPVCPLCQQPVRPGQFAGARDIELAAQLYLQRQYPNWQPELGACPGCVQSALKILLAPEARQLLQPAVLGILPLSLRLGANAQYDGTGVTMAFVDSGFSDHPDLAGRIKLYVDASTDEVQESSTVEVLDPLSWHGTMTSVMACGDGSMSAGLYRGLASGAEVVLIRVSNSTGRITEEGIQRGLGWLLTHGRHYGIQIVNISLGTGQPKDYAHNPVDLMVEALVAQGILVVCAAGNAGERYLVPPASAPSALTVGGLDDKNTFDPAAYALWHSNYGQTYVGVWKPELVAPSLWLAAPVLIGTAVDHEAQVLQQLLSAPLEDLPGLLADEDLIAQTSLPTDIASLPMEGVRQALQQAWQAQKLISPHYQHVDGTSFAAPIVSSVAAQMWQANPTLSPGGLKDLLMRTARYLPEVPPDQQGHGVVDPWTGVAAALATR